MTVHLDLKTRQNDMRRKLSFSSFDKTMDDSAINPPLSSSERRSRIILDDEEKFSSCTLTSETGTLSSGEDADDVQFDQNDLSSVGSIPLSTRSLNSYLDDESLSLFSPELEYFTSTEKIFSPTMTNFNPCYHHSSPTFTLYNMDITRFNRNTQFVICAGSLFIFTITYSYLQELISVNLLDRKLPLFLATMQFLGYTFWSFLLYANGSSDYTSDKNIITSTSQQLKKNETQRMGLKVKRKSIPTSMYVFLSLLRAMDFGLTNLSMKFLNYPAKTLFKSSRVIFTMALGALISRDKKYSKDDYFIVFLMMSGLAAFLHADANSSAMFHPVGIGILSISLICDAAVNNWTEIMMNRYGVEQDEFLYKLYSSSFVLMSMAALVTGELKKGFLFLCTKGVMDEAMEIEGAENISQTLWTPLHKFAIFSLFSMTGLLGSSSAAAITKQFGALAMSITSTTRKATTVFLSFLLFDHNHCTIEHAFGMILFTISLIIKSFRASKKNTKPKNDVIYHETTQIEDCISKIGRMFRMSEGSASPSSTKIDFGQKPKQKVFCFKFKK